MSGHSIGFGEETVFDNSNSKTRTRYATKHYSPLETIWSTAGLQITCVFDFLKSTFLNQNLSSDYPLKLS